MQSFKATYLNEMDKMYRKKKLIVLVLLTILAITIGQLTVSGVRFQFGIRASGSGQFPILVLSVLINTLLPLFTVLMSIDIFSGEFSSNTMKVSLLRPVSRLKLFSAKIAAIATFILASLLLVMVLSVLTGIIFNASELSILFLAKVFLAYILSVLPVLIFTLLIVILTNVFKSGTSVFFLSVLIFLGFKVISIIYPGLSNLLIVPSFGWYNLFLAQTVNLVKILNQFCIMIGYGIILFTVGYYLFDNKDI
jgi:hypothetical protein